MTEKTTKSAPDAKAASDAKAAPDESLAFVPSDSAMACFGCVLLCR